MCENVSAVVFVNQVQLPLFVPILYSHDFNYNYLFKVK